MTMADIMTQLRDDSRLSEYDIEAIADAIKDCGMLGPITPEQLDYLVNDYLS